MGHSSAVGFLVFALFFVACLSESVGGASEESQAPDVTADSAQKAVDDAKNSINDINEKAQIEVNKAEEVLNRVEAFKKKVDEAESQAEQALSEGEEAVKENKEAKTLVDNIKEISKTFSSSYKNAKDKAEKTNFSLVVVLKEAEKLKIECNKEEVAIKETSPNYKDINERSVALKNKASELNGNITAAVAIMGGVDSIEEDIEKNVKEAQQKSLKVRGIAAVAKIDTLMIKASSITQTTQSKKNEVNDIVQQLEELKATLPSGSTKSINALWKNTEAELTKATGAVEKAEEAQKKIKKEKELADTALKNFPTKSQVTEARKELERVEASVENLNGIVKQLKSELLKADNYIRNAKDLKQQIKTALSTTTGKPSTEQSEKTENSASTVRKSTETDQKDTTIQPTSKELPSQSDKSTEEIKDTLIKGAQNVPITALTGEKAPAPGAKNDSAMTVSVPLLVALIASAVLQ